MVDGLDWTWAFVIFADIRDFPGYKAGSDGSVWSCRTNCGTGLHWYKIKPKVDKSTGYLVVGLWRDGRRTTLTLHGIIARAFLGPKPDGMVCCHNNGDKTICASWNLRWDTHAGNEADKIKHRTAAIGSKSSFANLVETQVEEAKKLLAEGYPKRRLARLLNVHPATIAKLADGRTWSHVE